MRSPLLLGSAVAALVVGVVVLGWGQTVPEGGPLLAGNPGGGMVNAGAGGEAPGVMYPHAAVLEVARPEGAGGAVEDAVWEREIATYAAKIKLSGAVEALRVKPPAGQKIRAAALVSAEAFAAAIHVRQLPRTALIEVWADVGEDAEASAAVTRELVAGYLRGLKEEADARCAEALQRTTLGVRTAQEDLTARRAGLEEFRLAHAADAPLPANATEKAQVERAQTLRQIKEREDGIEVLRGKLNEMQRRLLDLALGQTVLPIRVVREAR